MAYFRVGGGGSSVGGPLINTTVQWKGDWTAQDHSAEYNFSEPVPVITINVLDSGIGDIIYKINGQYQTAIPSGESRTHYNVTSFTICDGNYPEGSPESTAKVQIIVNS